MPSQTPVYRDAAVEDASAIAKVWVAAWQAAYAGLMPAAYLDGLRADIAGPAFERSLRDNMSVLLVEIDGEVVGFTAYGASRDADAAAGTGELIAINLHPSHWRRGLGRELLRHTTARLQDQGCVDVSLWVLHGNTNARQFYEALGWVTDGHEKHDDTLTGFTLHEVRYRMSLVTREDEG